jgi:Uma2 family endonuclease
MPTTLQRATLDDLARLSGKAELIDGRIVEFMPTGYRPHRVACKIFLRLEQYCEQQQRGYALADGIGFTVPPLPSGRESFAPDAAYYEGPLPNNDMRFIVGPPTFAVEVRSENDYWPTSDVEYADKRADYFAAGTLAVWDVDPIAATITLYLATAPTTPIVFRPGTLAHAGPALPGWTVAVNDLMA